MRSICLIALLACFLIPPGCMAQTYTIADIPDSLKKNANSVVRLQETCFYQKSENEGIATNKRIVTILNPKGKEASSFIYITDRFRSLDGFNGKIYDGNGKLLRKIKKSELKKTAYSQHLASDNVTYFYECPYSSYPFTIEFEYDIHYKNGLSGYPPFIPVSQSHQSLEQSTYTLHIPTGNKPRIKTENTFSQAETSHSKDHDIYSWELTSLPAYTSDEPNSVPQIYALPETFTYEGYKGRYTSWQELGAWHQQLQAGRTNLPEEVAEKIRTLVNKESSERERIKVLYEYLGKQTRYVSIQLGIGGLQPMAATEVAQTQFGDCKALSNYLQAMLQAIGIPSYYTIISTRNKRLYPDFPNLFQCNHVILCVPQPKDTLWLECTNTQIPFGYIHQHIAGHDALVITPSGGKMVRLPQLPDSLQKQSIHAQLHFTEQKQMHGEVSHHYANRFYEAMCDLPQKEPKAQYEAVQERLSGIQAHISRLHFTESKTSRPSITCQYQLEGICNKATGSRLFIPVNPFRSNSCSFLDIAPKSALSIEESYNFCDTLEIDLPKGYTIETVPQPVHLQFPFGCFHSEIKTSPNKYTVIQQMRLRQGEYERSAHKQLLAFRQAVQTGYESVVIVKMPH